MCGIYGCVSNNAYEKVLLGLKRLQYRGYDSCGIAYYNEGYDIEKAVGALDNLKKINTNNTIAFGHTRWATNGVVNIENAHPHISFNKEYVLVHNGIIKNSEKLKEDLIKKGITFYSSTDTEVIVNFIAYQCERFSIEEVLGNLFKVLDGSYSLIIGHNKDLYLVKKFSPLNLLIADDGIYISSDISSLKDGKLYSLIDNDIIKISNNTASKINGEAINYTEHKSVIKDLNLGNFNHYMLKEINETPMSIRNTYYSIKDTELHNLINAYNDITLIGCGTAYHSCLVGEYLLNKYAKKNVNTYLASNYTLTGPIKKKHLHIIVSQSGETADCIRVAEQIKKFKGKCLLITNEPKSTLSKMSDYHIFTNAEKEIAVASTKTYCCQIFVFAYLCKKMLNSDYEIDIESFTANLENYIKNVDINAMAQKLVGIDKMILIAKDVDYITMLEASLKIREIDYIYTIPMFSGELKHGTLSLIEQGSIVLALNTNNNLQNAINEIQSRHGEVIDFAEMIPNADEYYKPIFSIIPFQLLSYTIAVLQGRNPDMPRNLAKSVTVE